MSTKQPLVPKTAYQRYQAAKFAAMRIGEGCAIRTRSASLWNKIAITWNKSAFARRSDVIGVSFADK